MEFQFESMSDFFEMGGYAFFVWLSFICTFICMLVLLFQSLFVSKKIEQGVKKEAARAQRIIDARAARQEKKQLKSDAELAESESMQQASESNTNLSDEVNHEPKT